MSSLWTEHCCVPVASGRPGCNGAGRGRFQSCCQMLIIGVAAMEMVKAFIVTVWRPAAVSLHSQLLSVDSAVTYAAALQLKLI